MAIKAGRVGVAPSQVDMAGNIIGSGGDSYTKAESDAKFAEKSDTYIKLEVDQMLASKVGIGQLEANDKNFYFAYDSTTQKYGYKLDNEGDFHPFESSAIIGLNLPEKVTTGLTFPSNLKFDSGGYQNDNGVCYVDIVLVNNGGTVSSGTIISGLPDCANGGGASCIAFVAQDKVNVMNFSANTISVTKDGASDMAISGTVYGDWYVRVIAMYKYE